jgi:hypothetical protein
MVKFGELQGTEEETVMTCLKVTLRRLLTVRKEAAKDTSQDMWQSFLLLPAASFRNIRPNFQTLFFPDLLNILMESEKNSAENIFGSKGNKVQGEQSRVHNEIHINLYFSPHIFRRIINNIDFSIHAARMDEL